MLDLLLLDPHAWESLATLTVLEIVLGIDNIIFLSIAAGQASAAQRRPPRAASVYASRSVMRIILLSSIAWIISLSEPFVTIWA